jgi:anti-sigma B factor antagonist
MSLDVRVQEKSKRVYTISANGSIDTNTYVILKSETEKVLEQSPHLIIFDMKDVKFVSSAGIGVILAAEQSAKDQGGGVLLVHLKPQIKKVFDVVRTIPSDRIFNTIEELDQYLTEIQSGMKDSER